MAQSQSPRQQARIDAVDVHEGDRVRMGINWHGEAYAGEYDSDLHQSVVIGEVERAPDRISRDVMRDGGRPMADFSVRTEDGDLYTWNVDNGYVIGPHPELGRRTDLGHFGGFYETE